MYSVRIFFAAGVVYMRLNRDFLLGDDALRTLPRCGLSGLHLSQLLGGAAVSSIEDNNDC